MHMSAGAKHAVLIIVTLGLVMQTLPAAEPPPGAVGVIEELPSVSTRVASSSLTGTVSTGAVDLTPNMPPVGNQGPVGSCAAWASGYGVKTCLEGRDQGWDVRQSGHMFSPSYLYNQINGGQDSGSYVSDNFRMMEWRGITPMSVQPYTTQYTTWPTQAQCAAAQHFRNALVGSVEYEVISRSDLNAIKAKLIQGTPLVISLQVDQAFDNLGPDTNYVWYPNGRYIRGGHALAVIGYDDNRTDGRGHIGALKIQNSWGAGWGQAGYCWVAYDALNTPFVGSGFYTGVDRADYQSVIQARIKVNHPKRGRVRIAVGVGDPARPVWQREVYRDLNINTSYGLWDDAHANVYTSVDCTGAAAYWPPTADRGWFVKVWDVMADGVTGAITEFQVVRGQQVFNCVSPLPVSVPDANASAVAYVGEGTIAPGRITDLRVEMQSDSDEPGEKLEVQSATASTQANSYVSASRLIDGKPITYWVSRVGQQAEEQWVKLDLGRCVSVGQVRLLPSQYYPQLMPGTFTVETSMDGESWTSAFQESGYTPQKETWYSKTFASRLARYVRLKAMSCKYYAYGYYMLLAEMEVYAGSSTPEQDTELVWTASGDKGQQGTAARYEVRWHTALISESSWQQAQPLEGAPAPQPAGTRQAMALPLDDLPYGRVYFAIRATGHNGEVGPVSSPAMLEREEVRPPARIEDLRAYAVRSRTKGDVKLTVSAVCASSEANSYYSAAKLTDGSQYTAWSAVRTDQPEEHWVKLDLGQARPVGKVRILPRHYFYTLMPSAFTIELSTDGSHWTSAIQESSYQPQDDTWYEKSFTTQTARYVRFRGKTVPYYSYGCYLQLAEMEVYTGEFETSSASLYWTAPGDHGTEGTAKRYEMRWGLSAITDDASWTQGTVLNGIPAPAEAGRMQYVRVPIETFPSGALVYFAMRTTSTTDQVSAISNCASLQIPQYGNQAPVLDSDPQADPEVVILPNPTTLSVEANDPNGDKLTYTWSMVSGPAPVAFTPNGTESSNICRADMRVAGVYTFRVTVSDGEKSVTGDVTVRAEEPRPPELELRSVMLEGVARPGTSPIKAVRVDGEEVQLTSDGQWSKSVTLTGGTTTVQIEVEDEAGQVTRKSLTMTQ